MFCLEIPELQYGEDYWKEHDYLEYFLRVLARIHRQSTGAPSDIWGLFDCIVYPHEPSPYSELEDLINKYLKHKEWPTDLDYIFLRGLYNQGYRGYIYQIVEPVIRRYCGLSLDRRGDLC